MSVRNDQPVPQLALVLEGGSPHPPLCARFHAFAESRGNTMRLSRRMRRSALQGFSLIELIGVLAIMAIIASVLVPNLVRSLDRAAIDAEKKSLTNVAAQLKTYVASNQTVPPAPGTTPVFPTRPTWAATLANYSDLSPIDLTFNKRNQARAYLTDPTLSPGATQPSRVLILSSMRKGFGLPSQSAITSTTFQNIWDAQDQTIPIGWAGWSAWNSFAGSAEYLIIQRVSLYSEVAVTLNLWDTESVTTTTTSSSGGAGNNGNGKGNGSSSSSTTTTTTTTTPGTTIVPYELRSITGTVKASGTLTGAQQATLTGVTNDVLFLKNAAGAVMFKYVLGTTNKTFVFNGAVWAPQ